MAGTASAECFDGVVDGQAIHVVAEAPGDRALAPFRLSRTGADHPTVALEPTVTQLRAAGEGPEVGVQPGDGRRGSDVERARRDAARGAKRGAERQGGWTERHKTRGFGA